ncbi:MAG: hypothetical protein WCK08_01540 [Betaproteobacteria bacterium]
MGLSNQVGATGANTFAGLDITDTHAHWVVLGQRGQQWQVQQHEQWSLRPGWVEAGQVLDYQSLVDALQQWLAGSVPSELAMALPAEVCTSWVVEAPKRLLPWGRRRWLARCAAELMRRPVAELSWSAHLLQGPRWRLMAAELDQVQDWLGLGEALGCSSISLDEAHQAAWRALDRWQEGLPPGACLFQVGSACVQALQERNGRWQWSWRDQGPQQDLIDRCRASVAGASVFVLGQSPLAQALQQDLAQAGFNPTQPEPGDRLQWASDLLLGRQHSGYWTALGLADRRRLA